MLISPAYAQETETTTMTAVPGGPDAAPVANGSAVVWNMGMILVLVVMFYFLLIRPQQKRFQAHKSMIDALKKGDKIVTAGGLVGTVDKITDGDDEVVIDLNGTKVTALRSTIQTKVEK